MTTPKTNTAQNHSELLSEDSLFWLIDHNLIVAIRSTLRFCFLIGQLPVTLQYQAITVKLSSRFTALNFSTRATQIQQN